MSECEATVRTTHGVIHCDRPEGHQGKHEGGCDTCMEADVAADITWDEFREDWLSQDEIGRSGT